MHQQPTQTDVEALRQIQNSQAEINKFFKDMRFRPKDLQNQAKGKTGQQKQIKPQLKLPNYTTNYRGQKIYSINDLKNNYQKAIFGTKWMILPYCRRSILGKIQFWCGASFIFTFMWGSYYMRKNSLDRLSWRYYRNTYALFSLASCAFVFLESMFFEPYCDINSYHYNNTDNIHISRDIKKQLRQITK